MRSTVRVKDFLWFEMLYEHTGKRHLNESDGLYQLHDEIKHDTYKLRFPTNVDLLSLFIVLATISEKTHGIISRRHR